MTGAKGTPETGNPNGATPNTLSARLRGQCFGTLKLHPLLSGWQLKVLKWWGRTLQGSVEGEDNMLTVVYKMKPWDSRVNKILQVT